MALGGGRQWGMAVAPRTADPAAARRQVAVRAVAVGCAWVLTGVLALLAVVERTATVTAVSVAGVGAAPVRHTAHQSLYRADPGPVTVLGVGLGLACAVATASLVWRAARRSTRVGATALVAAALTGVAALLGAFTVGPFIVPVAALLVVVALPLDRQSDGAGAVSDAGPWAGGSGSSR